MPTTDEAMTPAIHKPALGAAAAAFLAKKHQMLIDGKWVDARAAKHLRSRYRDRRNDCRRPGRR